MGSRQGVESTRRGFLRLGTTLAVGLVDACGGGATHGGQAASGGVSNFGGAPNASGGSSEGGAAPGGAPRSAGGARSTAGATSGGSSPSGGASAGVGAGHSGAGADAGSESGGASDGGAPSGGNAAGGSPSETGGSPNAVPGENTGKGCVLAQVPTSGALNPKLPDPFRFIDGRRLTRKSDWHCLRAELSALLQASVYGPKMPPPDSLHATFDNGRLTIDMKVGAKSGTFSVDVVGGGSAGRSVPCLITAGPSSLPELAGVARIDIPVQTIAREADASGLVRTLYGDAAQSSGAFIGWAWALSRVIDALEQLPEAGIDVKRVAVTGCSRTAKAALAMGAFDERVALTIVTEGGIGATALWRVLVAPAGVSSSPMLPGPEDHTFGTALQNYSPNRFDELPVDQHFVVALCAPRAVLILENDIDMLHPVATYGGGKAGALVYQALGIADRVGVSVSPSHPHCSFPESQRAYLDAFDERFLRGQSVATSGVDEFRAMPVPGSLSSFDAAQWIDWSAPALSGNLPWDPFA